MHNTSRRLLTSLLSLILLSGLLPLGGTRADLAAATAKLSGALREALTSNVSSVWLDPSRQTVRALIQTNGPVSSALTNAIGQAGGSVVRRFSSIDGLLADLPKSKLLAIAGRSDVERISADHLAQQSASHLEAATGADRVRSYNSLLQAYSGLDGSGVGIAILDSGIMAGHSDFGELNNLLGLSRVTAKTDIVSSNTNLAQYLLQLGVISTVGDLLGLNNDDGYGSRLTRSGNCCRPLCWQRQFERLQRNRA
jgi:subtilisin family serine protease